MTEPTAVLLAFVIVILTIMLSVIGVQVFFILREFRQTITKANKVLDDTSVISESVSKPISMVSAMVTGLRGGSKIVKILTREKQNKTIKQ